MTTNEIIGQIIGIIVIIGCIVNGQFPKKWQVLMGQIFLNLLSATNMFLVGAGYAAIIPALIASVHCTINMVRSKNQLKSPLIQEIIFSILYLGGWGLGFYFSIMEGKNPLFEFLPLIAVAFFVAALLTTKTQIMRLFYIGNASMYVIYNIIYPNSAIFAHIFTIVSFLIAIFRYRNKDDIDTLKEKQKNI